ncbi:expressed unknown protein [Seminavis robusta]|uniref:Uncharacterized protein n=1 Tax=Seminavis robusta TaxID=568900 RepID=A0A9N8E023_9STRA|nr:expressed unknown protein [Seminavis robusta]|eukprot:Sro429_g141110.1 n/a (140) ;mRNA; r:43016-43435
MSSAQPSQSIRSAYRTLARLIQQQPNRQAQQQSELRQAFRRPLSERETVTDRLQKAHDRISFLRITTPKSVRRRQGEDAGVFVVKDGKLVSATTSDANGAGRVVSNWDGKNLDPCMVKRHNVGLRRAGFVNNQHAKGIF